MKYLLIEDDPSKAEKISNFIQEFFLVTDFVIRGSYQSGLEAIFNDTFDFILLDMSIPTYDLTERNFGGKPRNYGGRDVLKEMKRYKLVVPVVVITQYNDFDGGTISINELDSQLHISHPDTYMGYIYYSSKETEMTWQDEIVKFINKIENENSNC